MDKGCLVISLDYEREWPFLRYGRTTDFRTSVQKANGMSRAIHETLNYFEIYGIHATWAVVGLILATDHEDAQHFSPSNKPNYQNGVLNPYALINSLERQTPYDQSLFFARETVEAIAGVKGQEIASHSFAHVFTKEEASALEVFEDDIISSVRITQSIGHTPRTFVFPKNQVSDEHTFVLEKHGFTAIRQNSPHKWYRYDAITYNRFVRFLRLLDAYVNLTGYHGYPINEIQGTPLRIKASRAFRPFDTRLPRMEPLKIRRIQKEMEHAAQNGLVYHLWWHPCAFGVENTQQNIANVKAVCKIYDDLRARFGMLSLNMSELAEVVNSAKDR